MATPRNINSPNQTNGSTVSPPQQREMLNDDNAESADFACCKMANYRYDLANLIR